MSTRFARGDLLGVAIGPDVERDDDGVRRRGQQHVRLVHRADAGVDDADLHLLVRQLGERVGEHFGRALHVGLDDDRQLLHAAFGDLRLQRFEREPAALRAERAVLRLLLAERGDLTRLRRFGDLEHVAGLRQAGQAEHFDRRRRPRRLGRAAAVVDERAHAADDRAGDERVADAERAVLHEHGRHRPAALVQLRFEHGAGRVALRIRLQLADVADEQDHFEQQIDVLLLLGRHFDGDRLAAPFFRHQIELGQLALDALGLAFGLSILLIATMIGTFAARAWSIASRVCGITPSSAATTRTTMSVTLAPRARIRVNASWPGVSRNTMFRPLIVT